MKNISAFVRLFLFGFFGAFIIFNFTMCPEKNVGPTDVDDTPQIETKELKDFSIKTENAFKSGTREEVLDLVYEDQVELLKEYFPNDQQKIVKFGEAFPNKKLLFANEFYAEYELTIDGKTYTIAMGNSGDGKWKLIRF